MPSAAGVSDLLVNSPGEMRRMAEWGVDAITTNAPDALKQVLGK
jgi:glycerophosphoryl diester phosphodiesterase